MNRIDLTNVGGFPFDEDALDFMQQAYLAALSAIARLVGNKVILYGVEVASGSVSSGWISYNGELIKFIGGTATSSVVINDTGTDATFEDDVVHTVFYSKSATCAVSGDFDFDDFVRLPTLASLFNTVTTHTHSYASLTGKPYSLISYSGSFAIGNPDTDSIYTVTIPDQGGTDYKVIATMVGLSSSHSTDNDISFIIYNPTKTATTFQVSVREYNAVSQNLRLDYIIIKNS